MKLLGLVYTLLSVCISFSSYATAVDSILKVNKSKSKKETIEALVSKAQLFYDKGKNGNACECLKAADSLSVQNEEILAPTILSHAVFCDFKNAMALPMLALHRSFNSLDASADNNALIKLSVFIGYRYLAAGEPDSFLIFNNKAESLINNNTPVSLKYLQVYYLGRAALHHEIYATADSAFNAAIHFATEMKDSSKLSQCWAKLGRSFDEQGNSFRADSFLKLSASYFKSKKDLQNLAHTYSQLSSVSIRIGQTETAIEYAFKALEIYKKNNYNKGISSEYVNIGRIYAQMKELDLALENYKQSLEYTKGSINPTASLSALSNIGATYVELGQPKQGLPYMLKAYKIEEELQLNSSLAMSCYNLSQAYDALNNTDSSLFYLSKCRDILEPTGDLMRLAAVNQGIGSIYLRQNKFKEACNYCLQAEEMAIKSNLVDVLDEVYNCLYVGNKALGNYQMALDYKEKYHVVQDSIRSVQNERKMAQLEAKQEFATIQLADSLNNAKIQAEKDAQIAVEQEKVKQQKTISYASVTGGVLLLLLAGSIYYSRRKTQKQNQEISAQKSAIEKRNTQIEWLLKEIHHRVKNNMQIVSSLMSIQGRSLKDEQSKQVIRESQNRIKSMSLVHESLYQAEDLSQVEIGPFIQNIAQSVQQSLQAKNQNIQLKIEAEKIELNAEQAVPVGIIINELASNAYKHAFVGREDGELRVAFKQEGQLYKLEVGDDGPALPEGFNVSYNGDSIGMALVQSLAEEQLGGSFQVFADGKSKFAITFSPSKAA